MRKNLARIALSLLVISPVLAVPVEDYKYLSWDEVVMNAGGEGITANDAVQGYKVYCRNPSIPDNAAQLSAINPIEVPNTPGAGRIQVTLDSLSLTEGDNWCAVTAWNLNNQGNPQEGDLSAWILVKKSQGRFRNLGVPAAPSSVRLE